MKRNRVLRVAGYVHATLFFALMIPLLYTVAGLEDPAGAGVLYLKCLLVAIPVIVTERAIKCVKSLAVYVLICVGMLAGIWFAAGLSNASGAYVVCYCIGMTAETFAISLKRLRGRLKASAHRKASEPFAPKEEEFLDTPMLPLVWYFVVIYLSGICLDGKPLCDMAFCSAAVYLFLALFCTYFRATDAYLEMNKRTKGIPRRRLYGVGFSMLLLFCAFLLICILPSALLAGQRPYTDIRHWFDDVDFVSYEYESSSGFEGVASGGMGMMELITDGEPAPEPSKLMNGIFWIIGSVCILGLVYGILQFIRQLFRDFRDSHDENGDRIEALEEPDKAAVIMPVRARGAEGEAEKIRRRYRKTIRRHRKEMPAPHEAPAEIEEQAGLGDDEQMQQLHRDYERVRYGKMT